MKKIITACLSMVAGLGLFFVVAAAPAAAYWGECGYGNLCAWNTPSGAGTPWEYAFNIYEPKGCVTLGSGTNNKWSAVWNRYGNGAHVVVWKEARCTGDSAIVAPTPDASQGFNLTTYWNNSITSFKIIL